MRVSRNYVKNSYLDRGHGLYFENAGVTLEADSNELVDVKENGIYCQPSATVKWKIRDNMIRGVGDRGINIINGGSGGEYTGNRVIGMRNGIGIVVNGSNRLVANNYIQAQGLGVAKGISLQSSGSGSKILFNSVNITGTDVVNGQALEVLGGTNYTIKNNIFANNGGGYAAYISTPVSSFSMNYNDYFSTRRKLFFYQNLDYDTLSRFVSVSGKDSSSKSVNPCYTSVTDLSVNQSLLNNTGIADTLVKNDIEGVLRGVNPDMGAKEFNVCVNDAGLNEFWGLANPLPIGISPVKVVLSNQGSAVLNSAMVQWEVNGVAQAPFNWSGLLGVQQTAIVTIGTYNFNAGSTFKLRAWVSSPNGTTDCNNKNDSCRVFDLGTPLCGVYTIGGLNADFTTFTDASVALNNAGIGCPVVFKVRAGSYNEQIKLYEVRGSSELNTITFVADTGYYMSNTSYEVPVSLRSGLRAYYKLDGNVADSSGNGNHGVNNNGVAFGTDRYGVANKVGVFNGSNSYVSAFCNVSERSYTLSFYFKSSVASCGLFSVSKNDLHSGGYDRGIYLENGRVVSYIWNGERIYTPEGISYSDGKWHHVALTYDSALIGQRLYVDGLLLAQGSKTYSDFNWQDKVMLGYADYGYANGMLDDVMIWDRSLSNNEIGQLVSGVVGVSELHYKESNPSNDFTLSLIGTDYVSFNKMGIRRTNGTGNLFIQNGAHHVKVENCRLGNVSSPNTSCDSVLTFRNNNMEGYSISLSQTTSRANDIIIENNRVNDISVEYGSRVKILNNSIRNLTINQSSRVDILGNMGWPWANDSFVYKILVNNSRDVVSTGNLCYVQEYNTDTLMNLYSNRSPVYRDNWGFIFRA